MPEGGLSVVRSPFARYVPSTVATAISVRPGQVWRPDNGIEGLYGTQKMIVSVDDGYAYCRSVGMEEESGRASRIRVDRLRPGSGGYLLDFDPAAPDAPPSEVINTVCSGANSFFSEMMAVCNPEEEELLASFLADYCAMEIAARADIRAYHVFGWQQQETAVGERLWHWCEADGFVLLYDGEKMTATPGSLATGLETERRLRASQSLFGDLLVESAQELKGTNLYPLLIEQLAAVAESFGYAIVPA